MSISVSCPHCRRPYRLKDRFAGKRVKCRDCTRLFDVPALGPEATEFSKSGDSIFRHEQVAEDVGFTLEPTPFMEDIERHVERTVGPISYVFHEIVSDGIHLDLLIVPPTGLEPSEEHPLGTDHFTIVTMGMSSRPMTLSPKSSPQLRFAELMIALPANWPGLLPDGTFDGSMNQEEAWWPVRWLKNLARLPHDYGTYLAYGHTVPNGDPPEPFASNTGYCCMAVLPGLLSPNAARLVLTDDLSINFYALWPMYAEEVDLKLEQGMDALLERWDEIDLFELIQPDRPNTCLR